MISVIFVARFNDRIETNEFLVDFVDTLLAKFLRRVVDLTIVETTRKGRLNLHS